MYDSLDINNEKGETWGDSGREKLGVVRRSGKTESSSALKSPPGIKIKKPNGSQ